MCLDVQRPVKVIDLRNPVHKLFNREQWDISDADYAELLPSMKLASKLLEVGMEYIATFLPSDSLHTQPSLRGPDPVIRLTKHPTGQDLEAAREELENLCEIVRFQTNDSMFKAEGWLGITRLTSAPEPWSGESPDDIVASDEERQQNGDTRRRLIVGIMSEYVDALKKFAANSESHLRARFFSAYTLAHEIGHVIYHKDFRAYNEEDASEPYVEDENRAELGFSFMANIFSGYNPFPNKVTPPPKRGTPIDWKNAGNWTPHLSIERKRPKYKTLYSISIDYMEKIVSEEFWAGIGKLKDLESIRKARVALSPVTSGRDVATATLPEWVPQRFMDDYELFWTDDAKDRGSRPNLYNQLSKEEIEFELSRLGNSLQSKSINRSILDPIDDEENFDFPGPVGKHNNNQFDEAIIRF